MSRFLLHAGIASMAFCSLAATPVSLVDLRRETWGPRLFIPGGGT
jgi:hypothetical protein